MIFNLSKWIAASIGFATLCCCLCPSVARGQQSAEQLRVFSASSVVGSGGSFSFSSTTSTDLSGSNWGFGVDESNVYHAALRHQQDGGVSNDWQIRIGQGGQIYSLRTATLGELVPPQSIERHFVDEVFQPISVDRSTRANGGQAVFYHQSGYYTDDNRVTQPTYAPLLISGSVETNAYSTLSLAVQADANSVPQVAPGILNYQRVRDLGDGVIEVTNGIYNFGGNTVDFHNLPWGGVRHTVLDSMLVANPGGGFSQRAIDDFPEFESQTELVNNTGGWAAFTQGSAPSSQGLAYVFGDTDAHLNEVWQTNRSSWRWGRAAGDFFFIPIRNFNIGTFRREVDIAPGDFFESRHFLVLGDVAHIESTIEQRGLVEAANYDMVSLSQSDSSRLAYRIETNSSAVITVLEVAVGSQASFETFAHPVAGSQPLFLMQDAAGQQFLSVDPYALSSTPYDGSTEYLGLLGFVVPDALREADRAYVELSTLLPASFYLQGSSSGAMFALQAPDVALLLGDVNRSGTVDFLDIAPFIALLSSGGFQIEADIDENESVDFLDIAPFIAILSET